MQIYEDLRMPNTLIEDCRSIAEQGEALKTLRAQPVPPNIFETAWARQLAGDGKLQKREQNFGGYYSGEEKWANIKNIENIKMSQSVAAGYLF